MTDPTDLDELASAYLDGEATDAERARVEADPELLARVERLRAVSEQVSADLPLLAETDAARLRRRALVAGADAPPAGPVAPPHVRSRATWLPSPALAAAILVVVGLVGLVLIVGGTSSDDADMSASGGGTEERTDATAPQPTTTDRAEGAEGSSGGGAGEAAIPNLGSFSSEAALTSALEALDTTTLLPDSGLTSDVAAATVDRCETTVVAGQGDLGPELAAASAELRSRPVLVFSHSVERDAGATVTQLTVVDTETCRVLFAVQR